MYPPENNEAPQKMEDVRRSILNLPPRARRDVLTGALVTILDATEVEGDAVAVPSRDPAREAVQTNKDIATEAMQILPPEAKKAVTAEMVRTLSPEAKKDVAAEAVRELPPEAQKDVTAASVRALPLEAKKSVATETVQTLSREAKKDVVFEAMQTLRPEDREEIVGLSAPDQPVTNRIWLIIVGAFSIVFVTSAFALIAATFVGGLEDIQLLLTVVTTVAGVLAGFISGRASSGGSVKPSSR